MKEKLRKKFETGKAVLFTVFIGLLMAAPARADWIDNVTAGVAQFMVWLMKGVGQLIVLIIGGVLIPVARYNDFANSPVVGAGWAVIRDAVNMFFVIIFIVVAFGTVLGIEKFKWRQQIPRLLLVAIFINFSRMLCGIMIDFSQVIMLTFINAVKDIAGGNFIQMFGLKEIMDMNIIGSNPGALAMENSDALVAAVCGLIMLLIVLVTSFFLTIAFLYRVVMLWVLVTVAPLTWFTKALEGIYPGGSNAYGDWWKKFTCALALGPILAFFLWLALAVAGSGNVSGFETSGAPEVNQKLLGIFEPGKLITFIVGISLLMVGLDQANDVCAGAKDSTMSAILGKAKSSGKAIAAAPVAAAGIGAAYGARLGIAGAKGIGKWGYRNTLGRGVNAVKDKITDKAGRVASNERMPAFLRNFAGGIESRGLAGRSARAESEASKLSPEQIVNALKGASLSLNDSTRKRQIADARRALADADIQKDPEKLAALQGFLNSKDKLTRKSAMEVMQETYKGDAGFKKQMNELEASTPSLFGVKKIEEKLNGDLSPAEAQEAIGKLANSQFSNADVRKQLKSMKVFKRDADGKVIKIDGVEQTISAEEALKNGGGGFSAAQIKAFKEGEERLEKQKGAGMESEPAQIAQAVASGKTSEIEAAKGKDVDVDEVLARGLAKAGKKTKKRAAFRQKLAASGLATVDVPPEINEEEIKTAAIAEQIAEGKHDGTIGTEDPKDWDERLKRLRTAAIKKGTTKKPSVLRAFDFSGESFKDDSARQDFAAAAVSDPQLLLRAIHEQTEGGKKNPSLDLVSALTPEVVERLMAKAKSTTGAEQDTAVEDLRHIFDSLATDALAERAVAERGAEAGDFSRSVEVIQGLRASFSQLVSSITMERMEPVNLDRRPVKYKAQEEIDRLISEIEAKEIAISATNVTSNKENVTSNKEMEIREELIKLNKQLKKAEQDLRAAKKGPGIF
jgi:hypothetical protein